VGHRRQTLYHMGGQGDRLIKSEFTDFKLHNRRDELKPEPCCSVNGD